MSVAFRQMRDRPTALRLFTKRRRFFRVSGSRVVLMIRPGPGEMNDTSMTTLPQMQRIGARRVPEPIRHYGGEPTPRLG
jgi:hypothetical protein